MKSLQLSIYLCIRYNEPELVAILIPHLDVNLPLETGTTLLHEAIFYRRSKIVDYLLSKGALQTKEIITYWMSLYIQDLTLNVNIEEHKTISTLFSNRPTFKHKIIYPSRSISSPF